MTRTHFGKILFALAMAPGVLLAQSFDSSGTSLLKGTYFVRQVLFDQFNSAGAPTRGTSLTGTITFDGNGSYSFTGQVSVSSTSSGAPQSMTSSGVYAVSSSGLLRLDDPLSSGDSLFGGVGTSALVASDTESSNVIAFMVAVPIASSSSNAALNGQYRVGSMDVTGADVTKTRSASFLASADGNGGLGTLNVLGQAANNSDKEVTQSLSGASYSLSGTSGTMTFPLASGATNTSQLISGAKQFAVSSDGNIFVGGAVNGYDMVIGIRNGTGGNSTYAGAYFSGGEDYDNSGASQNQYYFDAFYGSVNANGAGVMITHQRVAPSTSYTYDYTVDDVFTVSGGAVTETSQRFWVGAGGQAVLNVGRSSAYGLWLTVAAKTVAPPGPVALNPFGVTNTANYVPITNPVTPGEMVSLYGSGLASTTAVASALPLPTKLGNVTVTVNGTPAPIYSVSPSKIVTIVPNGLDPNNVYYALFQVTNNGTASNVVTMFLDFSAPGVFTVGQDGISDGAVTHANNALVSASNPAKAGETLVVYLTGLGLVSPAVADGAAAPGTPLSTTADSFTVYVDNNPATTVFSGLAPGLVGLYQINFTVPTGTSTGEVYLDISDDTNGAYNTMATLYVGASAVTGAVPSEAAQRRRARMPAGRSGVKTSHAHPKRAIQ